MIILDYDKILERGNDLNALEDYIPLALFSYIDQVAYFNRVSEEVKKEYYQKRTELMGATDYNEYLEKDLLDWLKKHEDYKEIII